MLIKAAMNFQAQIKMLFSHAPRAVNATLIPQQRTGSQIYIPRICPAPHKMNG